MTYRRRVQLLRKQRERRALCITIVWFAVLTAAVISLNWLK
jgi:hypothetical protein